MTGWISLHRKIREHPFYTEKRKFSKYEAWIDLIMLANHQDNKFMLGNQLVVVKRGSFITSEMKLMDKWDWGKEKLRSFLRLLESDGMIIKESSTKQTTITICNYEKHSSKPDRHETNDSNGCEDSADRQQTDSRPTADYEPYTNNNELIITNKKPSSPKRVYDESSIPYRTANYLYMNILKFKTDLKQPNLQIWSDDMRKLIELDMRDPKEIGKVIEWVTTNDFWQVNILSASKLRDKWDTITAKMKQEGFAPKRNTTGSLELVTLTDEERAEHARNIELIRRKNGVGA